MKLPPAPRILIVMMSAVGDAVHVLPLVTAIKRHDPAARITWVLQPGPASLITGHPDVDEVVVFRRSRGWRAFLDLRRELGGREFDIVLNLQVYFKASVVTLLAPAKVRLGFDRARARDLNWLATNAKIPARAPGHVQDQYFEFLDYLGVPNEPIEWKLGPWESERGRQREFFEQFDRPVVSLVIATSDPRKDWITERWAELHDALIDRYGLQPVLVGGRSDRELEAEARVREICRHPIVSTLGVPLRELVGILDGSALVISLDTGPLHMAVALNTPVITLVSFRNPKRTGPYRRFHDLIVDAYGDEGEDYPISQEKRGGRMGRVTVADVLRKVGVWADRYRQSDGTPEGHASP
jgi:heptosyltransferase I